MEELLAIKPSESRGLFNDFWIGFLVGILLLSLISFLTFFPFNELAGSVWSQLIPAMRVLLGVVMCATPFICGFIAYLVSELIHTKEVDQQEKDNRPITETTCLLADESKHEGVEKKSKTIPIKDGNIYSSVEDIPSDEQAAYIANLLHLYEKIANEFNNSQFFDVTERDRTPANMCFKYRSFFWTFVHKERERTEYTKNRFSYSDMTQQEFLNEFEKELRKEYCVRYNKLFKDADQVSDSSITTRPK